MPFWPGGLDGIREDSSNGLQDESIRTIPPGFSRGLEFSSGEDDSPMKLEDNESSTRLTPDGSVS